MNAITTTLAALTASTAGAAALALSDGTPVEFVKITSKDRIQVRVPSDHAELGIDPLRIFRRDGSHYKDATNLKLVIKEAAADGAPAADTAPAPTPAAAPDLISTATSFSVGGSTFDNLTDAKAEAFDLAASDGDDVLIYALVPVAKIGFTKLV